jgi:hypothetical protein
LGVKIDGVSSQVAAVASRVEVVEKQLISTNRAAEHQGAQLSSLDLRITILERGKTAGRTDGFCGGAEPWQSFSVVSAQPNFSPQFAGGSAATSSGGGRPESVASGGATSAFSATGGGDNDLSRVLEKQFRLPIKRRRLVVLGGGPPQYGKGTDFSEVE